MPPEAITAIQWVLSGVFAILFGVLGWWAKTMWAEVQKLNDDLQRLSIKIASDYTTNERFESSLRDLFAKLDRIIDMLGHKEDRK